MTEAEYSRAQKLCCVLFVLGSYSKRWRTGTASRGETIDMSIRLLGRCVAWLQEQCISSVHERDRQIVVSDYNAFAF